MSEKDIGEEFSDFCKSAKRAGRSLQANINSKAPSSLVTIAKRVLDDPRTAWFLIGMAVEGLGISVQFYSGLPAYPVLDVLVGGVLGGLLLYYQRKSPMTAIWSHFKFR